MRWQFKEGDIIEVIDGANWYGGEWKGVIGVCVGHDSTHYLFNFISGRPARWDNPYFGLNISSRHKDVKIIGRAKK